MDNKTLEFERNEMESKMNKEQSEADKLRHNYEILKEHEFNIIKDFESKKTREVSFYESTLSEVSKQLKEEQQRQRDLEESLFILKEEARRKEFELDKANEYIKNLSEQIEKLE